MLSVRMHRNGGRWRVSVLATCMLVAFGAHARDTASRTSDPASLNPGATALAIKVYDDRMTIAVAGAPQAYLYGTIDADAPRRLADLIQSQKVPVGSDIYLNATGDNIDAGIALGRVLRKGLMSTHLGRPTRGRRAKGEDKSSVCTGACAYAFLGGVYRWAPTGGDRFGVPVASAVDPKIVDSAQAAERSKTYLQDMGIDATAFTSLHAAAHDQVLWPTADQMFTTGLANNGRQPLVASYRFTAGTPRLELSQVGRRGEQRLTVQCKPGSVSFTAYNKVGASRAQQIVRHAARSYVEIDRREMLSQPFSGASVDRDAVIVSRAYPPNELGRLLSAKSVGAWVSQRNNTLRYGFAFGLHDIDRPLSAFHTACLKYAPRATKPGA